MSKREQSHLIDNTGVPTKMTRKTNRAFTLVELIIVVAILGILAGVIIPSVLGLMGRGAARAFSIESLHIEPSEVEAGQPINITTVVKNDGEQEGNLTILLKIDGLAANETELIIPAGQTEIITFTYSTKQGGRHVAEVDGLASHFIVIPSDVLPPPVPETQIEIIEPQNNAQVTWRHKVEGQLRPYIDVSELSMYVLIYPISSNGPWWVQPSVITQRDGHWETTAYFGRDPALYPQDEGELFYVIALATDTFLEAGQQWHNIPQYEYVSNAMLVRRK
jgi:prepilin-type N-terminal cleavage/methylation domain-containing protein